MDAPAGRVHLVEAGDGPLVPDLGGYLLGGRVATPCGRRYHGRTAGEQAPLYLCRHRLKPRPSSRWNGDNETYFPAHGAGKIVMTPRQTS